MMLARGQAAPLRFLIGVVTLWVAVRGTMLVGWQPGPFAAPLRWGSLPGPQFARWPARDAPAPPAGAVSVAVRRTPPPPPPARYRSDVPRPNGPWRAGAVMASRTMDLHVRSAGSVADTTALASGQTIAVAATGVEPAIAMPPRRWSGSAWMLLRGGGGGAPPLAPVGRIGGGQAGMRILYRLDDRGRLAAAARISRAIGGPRQTEAALGLDWTPVTGVHLMAERRIAIDRGGRDAFALGAAGGVYALPVATHWRLDGYAEAGVVGARRRDPYADGAVRIGREVVLGGDASLAIGGGAWGAAQPRATRLDIGPSAALRLPVRGRTFALAVDWRVRVAGDARPGSGPALTLGMDF